ncbi:MAG TPA: hypothetical protein VGA27_09980, partial [Candidatus Binatia bacterium]
MRISLITRCAVSICLTIVFAAASMKLVMAQEAPAVSPSKVERKNRAPISREIIKVTLPKPVEAKLK